MTSESEMPPKMDGTTIREVLQWADENVQCMSGKASGLKQWGVAWGGNKFTTDPTLYDALYAAWSNRDE